MRFLAEYDNQKNGKFDLFNKDFQLYWIVLGIFQIFYFITLVIKYTLLGIISLYNN